MVRALNPNEWPYATEEPRKVRVAAAVFTDLFARTADGRRLTCDWGEPDADGFYDPVFTATDDGYRLVDRDGAVDELTRAYEAGALNARAEVRAWAEAACGPVGHRGAISAKARDAILAALSPAPEADTED